MKRIVLAFCLLMALTSSAQENFIRGRLLDATTQEPVAFATIRVKGKSKGVISNEDGSFRIPQIFKEYGDTLQISSMGYQEMERGIANLSPNHINILRLDPSVFELEEAVILAKKKKGLKAKQIVRRAIRNMAKNYPLNPFSEIGYYRDYQKDKGSYVNLNEAILEVFDQGFDTSDSATTKIKVYAYRRNTDFKHDSVSSILYDYKNYKKIVEDAYLSDYGGNEFTILRVHDAIRNFDVDSYSFVNRFDKDLIRHHNFSKELDTYWNGESLYTITFEKRYLNYAAKGNLYISRTDFAVVKMEYAVYHNSSYPYKQKQRFGNEQKLIFEIDTEYQRFNDKLYLNYISFHNTFQVLKPPLFQIKDISVDLKRQIFIVYFNNQLDRHTALLLNKYNFEFRGKKIKFGKVEVAGEKVFLYPKMGDKERAEMFFEINAISKIEKPKKAQEKISKMLTTNIANLKDINGNLLNRVIYKDYDQFREFFVQQLKPKTIVPKDTLFMKKDKPIFQNQPIVKPDNFNDYWMNTPLQNGRP